MMGNFCISDIELIWYFILSKGINCTKDMVLCEDENGERVRYCKNKIQIFMILTHADMRCLQHDNPSYRIYESIKTIEITSKFYIKSGLFLAEGYYDNEQMNFKISNRINDPHFRR